jgi:hypothetical protein
VARKKRLRISKGVSLNAVQYDMVLRESETVCTAIVNERVAVYPLLMDNVVQLINEPPTP